MITIKLLFNVIQVLQSVKTILLLTLDKILLISVHLKQPMLIPHDNMTASKSQVWHPNLTFFSFSILSKTVENESFNSKWHNSHSKVRTLPKSKAHLLKQSIFVYTKHITQHKDLSVSNNFRHMWYSNNLINSYHHPNPALGSANANFGT